MHILFVLILGVLAASIFMANIQAVHSPTIQEVYVGQGRIQQSPESAVAGLDKALNGLQPPHLEPFGSEPDVSVPLALFSNNSVIVDSSYISCPTGGYSMEFFSVCPGGHFFGTQRPGTFTGLNEIHDWLARLAENHIQVKELSSYQVTGSNVTWTLAVSVDEYRSLRIAPLVANAKAVVQDGKIRFLALELNSESVIRLQAAEAALSGRGTVVQTNVLVVGILSLGLVLPAAAMYYIFRVKSLFAGVPRLERPWLLLQVGVGALFLALLFIVLRDLVGISLGIWDAMNSTILIVSTVIFLVAMLLMKRAWTIPSSE